MSGLREEMLALRAQLLAETSEPMTAEEFAPLMGDLQQEYWTWQLGNYFESQGA